MKDEVDFLPADKCQMFPQIKIIILGVCGKACPSYQKNYLTDLPSSQFTKTVNTAGCQHITLE